MKKVDITVKHQVGLHARPASLFVKTSQQYTSKITITFEDKTVNAKSILSILGLGVTKGAKISIAADGEDADTALNALKTLVENNFGE
ncbi:MAG: HPr family phosphocarrier protein [Anaerolineaceae bacterium]|nr:HPr family phosphocarrier protein [Anaerolineaceae bacterium]